MGCGLGFLFVTVDDTASRANEHFCQLVYPTDYVYNRGLNRSMIIWERINEGCF